MVRYLALTIILTLKLSAQQVTLQPWTQVYGTVQGQRLGNSVSGLGKYLDTTRIAIATNNEVGIYYMKTTLFTVRASWTNKG